MTKPTFNMNGPRWCRSLNGTWHLMLNQDMKPPDRPFDGCRYAAYFTVCMNDIGVLVADSKPENLADRKPRSGRICKRCSTF